MVHANKAELDCGNVAALAALELISGLAAFGRAPLEVVVATLGEAAKTWEVLMPDAWSRNERPPLLNVARLSPLVVETCQPN